MLNKKVEKRIRRHKKIRSRISGTSEIPRVSVYKSLQAIYAQVIDDTKNHTIASVSTKGLSGKKIEQSREAGKKLAEILKKSGIEKIVFDRGGNRYIGRVKEFADGLREGGIEF